MGVSRHSSAKLRQSVCKHVRGLYGENIMIVILISWREVACQMHLYATSPQGKLKEGMAYGKTYTPREAAALECISAMCPTAWDQVCPEDHEKSYRLFIFAMTMLGCMSVLACISWFGVKWLWKRCYGDSGARHFDTSRFEPGAERMRSEASREPASGGWQANLRSIVAVEPRGASSNENAA